MNHFTDGQYAACVGIDWADTKHDVCLQAAGCEQREFSCLPHQVDDIEQSCDKSEAFFHDITLLPRHGTFSRKERKCYPCLRKDVLPMCRVGQTLDQEGRDAALHHGQHLAQGCWLGSKEESERKWER